MLPVLFRVKALEDWLSFGTEVSKRELVLSNSMDYVYHDSTFTNTIMEEQ